MCSLSQTPSIQLMKWQKNQDFKSRPFFRYNNQICVAFNLFIISTIIIRFHFVACTSFLSVYVDCLCVCVVTRVYLHIHGCMCVLLYAREDFYAERHFFIAFIICLRHPFQIFDSVHFNVIRNIQYIG